MYSRFHSMRWILVPTLAGVLVHFSSLPVSAQDVKTLLQKMEDVYGRAKSFQGTLYLEQKGKLRNGKEFLMRLTEEIHYAAPNRFLIKATTHGEGAAKNLSAYSTIRYCDGKNYIVYDSVKNRYTKAPASAVIKLTDLLKSALPSAKRTDALSGDSVTINNRSALTILIPVLRSAPLPSGGPTTEAALTIEKRRRALNSNAYAIDKENFHLLQARMQSKSLIQEMKIENQVFDKPIPDSALAFNVPTGAVLTFKKEQARVTEDKPESKP